MTSATTRQELIAVIGASTHVLIDFDGPICEIFAGLPAETVAARLLELLTVDRVRIPPQLQQERDPLEVLRFAATVGRNVADRVDTALCDAELQAVASATPTPSSRELMVACGQTDRSVGIVSNNSQAAVEKYLREHDLAQHVDHVAARTDPYQLKPNPHLIFRSMDAFARGRERFVLVGDSVADIEAAQAAGIKHIGYANKPGKWDRLTNAGANAMVTTLVDLTKAIEASPAVRPSEA